MEQCGQGDPIDWLGGAWGQTVNETRSMLQAMTAHLDQGHFCFTDTEIRSKLTACMGSVDDAATSLVSEREKNVVNEMIASFTLFK